MLPPISLFEGLVKWLAPDAQRQGLAETPKRMQAAWAFWTKGYAEDPAAHLKTFEDGAENYDTMVFQGNIPIFSHCEHHLAPFFGVAHVGYIPNGRIVGLSKLSRVVDVFARRLQVQERLCTQVADCLHLHLKPAAVGVVLQCRHMCMESRGVQKIGAVTTTTALRGQFRTEPETRAEFMSLVGTASQKAAPL